MSLLGLFLALPLVLAQDAPGAPVAGEPIPGDEPPEGKSEGFAVSRPFILTIADPGQLMSAAPIALLCEGALKVPLKDDGMQPDVREGDATYAGISQTCDTDVMDIQLMVDDEEFFAIDVELPSGSHSPSVMISFSGDEVLVEARSDDPSEENGGRIVGGGGAPIAEGGQPPAGGEPTREGEGLPPVSASGVSARRAVTSGGGRDGGGAAWWTLLGALLLGGAAGYGAAQLAAGALRRRGLSRVGAPDAPASPLARLAAEHPRAVWVVPDAADRAAVVQALASLVSERLVMLVPLAENRAAHAEALRGRSAVFWTGDERAELDRLVSAARRLADEPWGVAVVVEGVEALESPLKGEVTDAVLQDLISEEKLSRVVAVVTSEVALSAPPAVTLARGADGLYLGERRILAAAGPPGSTGEEAGEE